MFKNYLKRIFIYLALIFTLFAGVSTLQARAESVGVVTPEAEFQLISATLATGDLQSLPLGLKVRLKQGWKIYWRSPGDAGLPPEVKIAPETATQNQKLEMDFPVPSRFSLFGLDTYGYSDEVIFPIYLHNHPAGEGLGLKAQLNALVCADICIPVAGELSLDIPAGGARASADAQDIARFASLVPKTGSGRDIALTQLSFLASPARLLLEMGANTPPLEDVFVEAQVNGLGFSAPQLIAPQRYEIQVSGTSDKDALLGRPISLTIKTRAQFQQIDISALEPEKTGASSPVAAHISTPAPTPILFILLAAFLGGIILNIMPCVLPVLSLKLASILSMGGASPSQIRTRLLVGASGILTSFGMLALGLVAIKLAGGQLGWGIQFQNPWFLGGMILVMVIFTLSLLDIIRLPVPAFAVNVGGRGLLGDFASGFMATILATPCSAPLVGTAVSFALAASAPQLFFILLVMGLGLAMPWILLALFPRLIAAMPAPGAWMKWVKPVLASGLVATIIWLGWLFAGASGLLTQNSLQRGNAQAIWQLWAPEEIETALAEGRPVFVDVTADWCITCKVNKALALNTKEVGEAFAARKVVLLQADWTLPDPEIADYLASFGRFGIPFNILYYPDGRAPLIFDELLSAEKILSALDKLN